MQSKSYSDDVNSNIQNNNLIYLSKTDYKERVFFITLPSKYFWLEQKTSLNM